MLGRLQTVVIGTLFWLVFGAGTLLTVAIGQPLGILVFATTGDLRVRNWVYSTGKATDQLCNAAFFGGNPKETISSHTGRWYWATPDESQIPARFRFVKWLTDKFEVDHVIGAIEAPFKDEPL